MSRYAATRDGETALYPGYSTGLFYRQLIDADLLNLTFDPEGLRRMVVDRCRRTVLTDYAEKRAESLTGPSRSWMKPPGRVRFRWVRRTFGPGTGTRPYLELTAVVYNEGALP